MNLTINPIFRDFVEFELLPDLDIEPDRFWAGLQQLIDDLTPENRRLLEIRSEIQQQIDNYHIERRGQPWDAAHYREFLTGIGYLQAGGEPFTIETSGVDPEIARVAWVNLRRRRLHRHWPTPCLRRRVSVSGSYLFPGKFRRPDGRG